MIDASASRGQPERQADTQSPADPFREYAATYSDTVNKSIALSGDSVEDFARIKADLVAEEVGTGVGMTVLDFGCGTGVSSRALARALPALRRLAGVDPSSESLDIARRTTTEAVDFVHAPQPTLPFHDNSFDVVFSACVFHHIDRAEHAHWVSEIRRVLAPGGRVFVFEHNPANPLTRRAVRACPFDRDVRLLSARYTAELLRNAGFEASQPRFYYFVPRILAILRRFERGLRWCPLGAQYYVSAVKRSHAA